MKIIKKDGTLTKEALTFGNGALRVLTYPEQKGKIKLPACYINEFRYREFFDKFRVSYELKDELKTVNRGAKRAVLSLSVTEYQLAQMLREQDDLQFVVKDDGVQFFGVKADNGDGMSSGYNDNGIFKLCFVQAKDVNRDIVGLSEEDFAVDLGVDNE